jgi:hypothetical protein
MIQLLSSLFYARRKQVDFRDGPQSTTAHLLCRRRLTIRTLERDIGLQERGVPATHGII